jgi:menaquinone-dependent protoporphyrinogen oxidase
MRVLVAFASRHGATKGIAERIAGTLRTEGLEADALPAQTVKALRDYDAVVIGSGAYMGHWLKEATAFARHQKTALSGKPVWLFSSGPLGTEPTNAKGQDQKEAAVPVEIGELSTLLGARDHQVFFGVYHRDQKPIGIAERFMSVMPAAKAALPDGDFRDWPEIEGWAKGIARELTPQAVPSSAR